MQGVCVPKLRLLAPRAEQTFAERKDGAALAPMPRPRTFRIEAALV
jgi:hypothetical protein